MRYGDLKLAVAGSVIEMLRPFRKRYDDLMNNKDYLMQVAREGQVRASEMASKKLAEFKKAIGYVLI